MVSKKILKLNYIQVKLPSIWNESLYYPLVYNKSIKEIKGYFEVGWQELKYVLPAEHPIIWNVSRLTYFKLAIGECVDNLLESSIVGFDQINKSTQKILKESNARHITYITTENKQKLQLQILYCYTKELSTANLKQLRADTTTMLNAVLYANKEQFFNEYLSGMEHKLLTNMYSMNKIYSSIKGLKIVKCKIV